MIIRKFLQKSFDTFMEIKGVFALPLLFWIISIRMIHCLCDLFEIPFFPIFVLIYICTIIYLNVRSEQLRDYWDAVLYRIINNPILIGGIKDILSLRYIFFFKNNFGFDMGIILGCCVILHLFAISSLGIFGYFFWLPATLILIFVLMWTSFSKQWILALEVTPEEHEKDFTHNEFKHFLYIKLDNLRNKRRKLKVDVHRRNMMSGFFNKATEKMAEVGSKIIFEKGAQAVGKMTPEAQSTLTKGGILLVGSAVAATGANVAYKTRLDHSLKEQKLSQEIVESNHRMEMENKEFIFKCRKEGFECVTETTSTGKTITKIVDLEKSKSSSSYWEFSTNKAKVNIPSFPKDSPMNPSSPYELTYDVFSNIFFFT